MQRLDWMMDHVADWRDMINLLEEKMRLFITSPWLCRVLLCLHHFHHGKPFWLHCRGEPVSLSVWLCVLVCICMLVSVMCASLVPLCGSCTIQEHKFSPHSIAAIAAMTQTAEERLYDLGHEYSFFQNPPSNTFLVLWFVYTSMVVCMYARKHMLILRLFMDTGLAPIRNLLEKGCKINTSQH